LIAYFILVHRFPEQFKRMFRAIYVPGNQYLIHVDRSSGPEIQADIAVFLKPYQGTAILEPRPMLWGGYSLVDAELRGMAKLLKMSKSWTHYINLSGQDFPLKSQAYIRDYLRLNRGKQYIRAVNQHLVRPDTINRISHYFIEAFGRMFRTGIKRRLMAGVTPFIGTQWKVVTRAFCEFATTDASATPFRNFYRRSFIADEGFFQTLMMNSGKHGQVVNDDLRTIDWVPDGDIKLRPRTFVKADAMRLSLSPDLFARKFDESEDSEIFDHLEAHLLTPAASQYRIVADNSPQTPEPALAA
jgi:Core-2/I-Branching enzyme